MEAHLRTVEQSIARIDAILPTLATESDVQKEVGDATSPQFAAPPAPPASR